MARRGRPKKEESIHEADKSAKIDVETDLTEERKDEWLKRRAKEDRDAKEANKVVDTWYVLKGNKLVSKTKKSSGGVYAKYVCNVVKFPEMLEDVKTKGLLRL